MARRQWDWRGKLGSSLDSEAYSDRDSRRLTPELCSHSFAGIVSGLYSGDHDHCRVAQRCSQGHKQFFEHSSGQRHWRRRCPQVPEGARGCQGAAHNRPSCLRQGFLIEQLLETCVRSRSASASLPGLQAPRTKSIAGQKCLSLRPAAWHTNRAASPETRPAPAESRQPANTPRPSAKFPRVVPSFSWTNAWCSNRAVSVQICVASTGFNCGATATRAQPTPLDRNCTVSGPCRLRTATKPVPRRRRAASAGSSRPRHYSQTDSQRLAAFATLFFSSVWPSNRAAALGSKCPANAVRYSANLFGPHGPPGKSRSKRLA